MMKRKGKEEFIKKHKVHLGIPIVLLTIVLLEVSSIIFVDTMSATRLQQRMNSFGMWHGVIYDSSEELDTKLSDNAMVEKIGHMTICGDICDKNGVSIGSIGFADQDMIEIGKINLLDGRLPTKPNDIALETYVLNSLGCSYELGQKINLNVQVYDSMNNASVECVSFNLCGVVRNYSNNWKTSSNRIISGYVSPSFSQIEGTVQHLFIKLDDRYVSYAKDLEELCSYRLILNDYTYLEYSEEQTEYKESIISFVVILLAGFSIIILLINNEIIKKQTDFVTWRILGATRKTIVEMFCREKIYIFFAMIVAGTILGTMVSFLIYKVCVLNGIEVVYSFDKVHIMQFLAVDAGGMCVAILFGLVRLFHISLRGKAEQQGRYPLRHVKEVINSYTIFSRFKRMDRMKRILSYALSIISMTLIFISSYQTMSTYRDYKSYIKDYPIDYSYGLFASYVRPMKPESEETVRKISEIYGVSDVQSYSVSKYYGLEFDGIYDERYAEVVTNRLIEYYGMNQIEKKSLTEKTYGILTGISDNLYPVYQQVVDIKKDGIYKDNEVILYVPDLYVYNNGSIIEKDQYVGNKCDIEEIISERKIKEGDTFVMNIGEKEYKFVISSIIRQQSELPFCYRIIRPYSVICSQRTYDKVCGGNEFVYLLVKRKGNTVAYQTDVELSKINTSLFFNNFREKKDEYIDKLYTQFVISILLSSIIFVMTMMARCGIQSITNNYEAYRSKTLYQLGMTKNRIKVEMYKDAGIESIICCIIAVLFEIKWLLLMSVYRYKTMENPTNSTKEKILQICNEIIQSSNWGFILTFACIVCAVYVFILSRKVLYIMKEI